MPRNNIMVLSLARGGTTLLSLILGANKSITNFGESHWIFKGSNKVDNSCRAHGEGCKVISELIKKDIKCLTRVIIIGGGVILLALLIMM